MAERSPKEFTVVEGLAIFLAFVGTQLASEVVASWGTYFLSPTAGGGRTIYVAIGVVGVVFVAGRVFDFITDPLFGVWSDKTPTRPGRWRIVPIWGRRRPFMFWGSILMTATSIAFWFPPVAETSTANLVYATVVMCLHWCFFTLAYIALLGLCPEIARSERGRITLGVYVSAGLLFGLALSNIVPGILIDVLGFQTMGIVFAAAALIMYQAPVWLVKERYDSAAHADRVAVKTEFRALFKNQALLAYFFAFFLMQMGQLAVQRVVPYWAEVGLGGDEGTVSILMLPFIGTAAITLGLMPAITRILSLRTCLLVCIFMIGSGLPAMYFIAQYTPVIDAPGPLLSWWMGVCGMEEPVDAVRVFLGASMFAWSGIGQGMFYVLLTPLIGEIVDYDEGITGERREALFNGLSGVAIKSAQTVAILIATQSMSVYGNSVENPLGILLVGPIGGMLGAMALVAAWFYPKLRVTPERPEDVVSS